jgi:FAD:protein FMN transferase
MLIGVDTAHRVAGVQILVYREPRGGEVSREYFLRQYRGKSVGDPIRMNRDIINISGATISVQSVNTAVKKTLALVSRYYVAERTRPAPHALLPLDALP